MAQQQIIFIVDDDTLQLQMVKDSLNQKYSFQLHEFTTGEEALKNMHLQPDIVLLDYHLKSVNQNAENGIEILKKMKEVSPAVQVIMLSGQEKISVAVDCMKYGAYDYVAKSESAFLRIENLINNITNYENAIKTAKSYKTGLYVAIGVIVILAVVAVAVVKVGWANSHLGGFN